MIRHNTPLQYKRTKGKNGTSAALQAPISSSFHISNGRGGIREGLSPLFRFRSPSTPLSQYNVKFDTLSHPPHLPASPTQRFSTTKLGCPHRTCVSCQNTEKTGNQHCPDACPVSPNGARGRVQQPGEVADIHVEDRL